MKNITFSKLILLFFISMTHTVFYPVKFTVENKTDKPFNVKAKPYFGEGTNWFNVPAMGQAFQNITWCLSKVETDIMQGQLAKAIQLGTYCPHDIRATVEKDEKGSYKLTVVEV